jgi:hypothetical protein
MGIGVSLFLMAVGAILAFAMHLPADGISLDTVGVILILLGLVGLFAHLVLWEDWTPRRRTFGRYDDRFDGDAEVIVRRRRPRIVEVDIDDEAGVVDVAEERPVVEGRRVTTRRTIHGRF